MIEGSCLCGQITYQYDGDIQEIAMCHCSQCRRAQGGAFATNCPVESDKLVITGTEHIRLFQSSEKKVRAFCMHCGSALYSENKAVPGVRRLRLGTVSTTFTCSHRYHIWSDSRASWDHIADSYPQFKEARE